MNRFLIYLLFSEDASLLFGDLEFTDQLSLQCLKQCKSNGKCFIVCVCGGGGGGGWGRGVRGPGGGDGVGVGRLVQSKTYITFYLRT